MITTHLLDMLVSKKVSGHGRDQALNLLNKNVPRKDQKIKDNTKSLFVIDTGDINKYFITLKITCFNKMHYTIDDTNIFLPQIAFFIFLFAF